MTSCCLTQLLSYFFLLSHSTHFRPTAVSTPRAYIDIYTYKALGSSMLSLFWHLSTDDSCVIVCSCEGAGCDGCDADQLSVIVNDVTDHSEFIPGAKRRSRENRCFRSPIHEPVCLLQPESKCLTQATRGFCVEKVDFRILSKSR